ncbi:hypothetical protein KUTeg_024891 [Tegillarca granosa]|uniref:REJ domain-containing protein n=1 Tax=Tegillarca granosa TaxID=220873 RepID=A0ABQ9E4C5_TEGGR|nr:hypothetical protein KUTeg_024891 [Tegillarca granosa]
MSDSKAYCKSYILLFKYLSTERCAINCKEKYAVTSIYSARAVCEDCPKKEVRQLTYRWQIFEFDATTNTRTDMSADELTDTGLDKSSIVLKENIFTEGKIYELQLTITSPLRAFQGVSTVTFKVNYPPYGGNCTISPSIGRPMKTAFVVTCSGWKDEGMRSIRDSTKDGREPLTYEYICYKRQNKKGVTSRRKMPLFTGSEYF